MAAKSTESQYGERLISARIGEAFPDGVFDGGRKAVHAALAEAHGDGAAGERDEVLGMVNREEVTAHPPSLQNAFALEVVTAGDWFALHHGPNPFASTVSVLLTGAM